MSNVDWIEIETQYRGGSISVNALAREHQLSEGAIRKRAKKHGWLRDPEGVKRQIVKAALSGGTKPGTSGTNSDDAVRTAIEAEAQQDIDDLSGGLNVARQCIRRLQGMAEKAAEPRDIKIIAEANRISVETIMRIRGLEGGEGKSIEDILIEMFKRRGEPVEE